MIRQSLTANSAARDGGRCSPQRHHAPLSSIKRPTTGATTSIAETGRRRPASRAGCAWCARANVITTFQLDQRHHLHPAGHRRRPSPWADPVYVGPGGHQPRRRHQLATAMFDNVTVTTPTPLPPAAPDRPDRHRRQRPGGAGLERVSGATSYTVKRGTDRGRAVHRRRAASGVTGTSFTNTGLTNGTTYYYVVSGQQRRRRERRNSSRGVGHAAAAAAAAGAHRPGGHGGQRPGRLAWTAVERRHQLHRQARADRRWALHRLRADRDHRHQLHRHRPGQRHDLLLRRVGQQRQRRKRQLERGVGHAGAAAAAAGRPPA